MLHYLSCKMYRVCISRRITGKVENCGYWNASEGGWVKEL